MVIATVRRASSGPQGGVAAADVHPAALWLPLLKEALRILRYRDLNVWQKRTAWHGVQRLSTALLTALQNQPAMPPEKQAVHAASRAQQQQRACAGAKTSRVRRSHGTADWWAVDQSVGAYGSTSARCAAPRGAVAGWWRTGRAPGPEAGVR